MPWCFVCANNVLRKNHDESEEHQLATARLVVSDADAGYCLFCCEASGNLSKLESCRDSDHAKKLAEARELLERSTTRDK